MKHALVVVLLAVACGIIALAFSARGKEGMFIFFLGSALLLCTLAVVGLRVLRSQLVSSGRPETNAWAIFGAVAGLFAGGYLGATMGFGRVMITIFNPDLPERDFGTSFGAIGGGLLGAFFAALLGGAVKILLSRKNQVPPIDGPT